MSKFNCKVIEKALKTGAGSPEIINGKCLGYGLREDDEPINDCKSCKHNSLFEE